MGDKLSALPLMAWLTLVFLHSTQFIANDAGCELERIPLLDLVIRSFYDGPPLPSSCMWAKEKVPYRLLIVAFRAGNMCLYPMWIIIRA